MTGHEVLDIATDGFVTLAEGAGLTVRPNHPFGEAFRIRHGASVPEAQRIADWQQMRDALFHQQSRNLFYFGHGGPDGLGASLNTNLSISASEIADRLHTIPAGQTNRHGYRFVFLYGCETASGGLSEAFGIPRRENVPMSDFQSAGLTPGAFVGWNHAQAAGVFAHTMLDNANFIQHFQQEWGPNGLGVSDALDRASQYHDVVFIQRNRLKVFGNWQLNYFAFNR